MNFTPGISSGDRILITGEFEVEGMYFEPGESMECTKKTKSEFDGGIYNLESDKQRIDVTGIFLTELLDKDKIVLLSE
jgi:hypothetical protein